MFSQIRMMAKERIAKSGLRGFRRMQALGVLLEFGRWLKDHECEAVFESRYDLYQYVNSEIVENAPIDYLEFGVYRGDSIIYWTQLNRDQNSRFFGFDSFEGLPEDWVGFSGVAPRGSFGVGGRIPQVNDPRVEFVKGYFQTVLPDFLRGFAAKNRLLVHCDADLYTSTLCALASLNQVIQGLYRILHERLQVVGSSQPILYTGSNRSGLISMEVQTVTHLVADENRKRWLVLQSVTS